jgi:hypothetical protein
MLEQWTKKANVVGSIPYVENGQAARASVTDVHKVLGPPPKILEDQPGHSVKMDVFSCKKEMRDFQRMDLFTRSAGQRHEELS